MRFVSHAMFPYQLDDRYMYLRFCTNQAIRSGQNILNYAVETMQFEVYMTKKVDNFLIIILYSCVSIVVTSIIADDAF